MKYSILALLFAATLAGAVVNPDTPHYVDAFHQRIEALSKQINDQANTTLAMDQGSRTLAQTLDDELNAAYKKLMARLPPESRTALRTSQRQWLLYRDAEFEFLGETFTRARYGSSASLTGGASRNTIVYSRAEQLWSYLENL